MIFSGGLSKRVISVHLAAGQRLCSAQRNQPQRSLHFKRLRTSHTLRLVSDTAAVRSKFALAARGNSGKILSWPGRWETSGVKMRRIHFQVTNVTDLPAIGIRQQRA